MTPAEEQLIRDGEEAARQRLTAAIKEERRTGPLPPGVPSRDKAVEEMRDAEAVAAEWKVKV